MSVEQPKLTRRELFAHIHKPVTRVVSATANAEHPLSPDSSSLACAVELATSQVITRKDALYLLLTAATCLPVNSIADFGRSLTPPSSEDTPFVPRDIFKTLGSTEGVPSSLAEFSLLRVFTLLFLILTNNQAQVPQNTSPVTFKNYPKRLSLVAGPLIEEGFHRYVPYQLISTHASNNNFTQREWETASTLVGLYTSVIFGLSHWPDGKRNVALATFSGMHYWWVMHHRSLVQAIGLHSLNNALYHLNKALLERKNSAQ